MPMLIHLLNHHREKKYNWTWIFATSSSIITVNGFNSIDESIDRCKWLNSLYSLPFDMNCFRVIINNNNFFFASQPFSFSIKICFRSHTPKKMIFQWMNIYLDISISNEKMFWHGFRHILIKGVQFIFYCIF